MVGVKIVSSKWLVKCFKKGRQVDTRLYEIENSWQVMDKHTEKKTVLVLRQGAKEWQWKGVFLFFLLWRQVVIVLDNEEIVVLR